MDFNNIIFHTYFWKPEKCGFSVYHIENGIEVWDYSFMKEVDAKAYTTSRNANEAKRVADAKARIEAARRNIVALENPYHYSITGYYGD